jgi:hypothetical protein
MNAGCWPRESLRPLTDDEAIAAITPNLQHYVDGELTSAK